MVADGERVVSFPVGRNVHRDGILDLCIVPAEVDSGVLARMKAQSERFMRDCGYRGILAIEYFIKGGEIYFNEMAPRPHNSGHYTIEGATTNQFRELVRYLVGEPLQEPQPVAPTVMKTFWDRISKPRSESPRRTSRAYMSTSTARRRTVPSARWATSRSWGWMPHGSRPNGPDVL